MGVNAVLTITFGGTITNGSFFTLTCDGQTTAPIPYVNTSVLGTNIASASWLLPNVGGASNLSVVANATGTFVTVTFQGTLGSSPWPTMGAVSALTGTAPTITMANAVTGIASTSAALGTGALTLTAGVLQANAPVTLTQAITLNSNTGVNALQTLTFGATNTGGVFSLAFNGQTTALIAYSATFATLQANIQAAARARCRPIESPNNLVIGGTVTALTVTFVGALGDAPQNLMTAPTIALTGGTNTLTFASTTAGVISTPVAFNGSAITLGGTVTASNAPLLLVSNLTTLTGGIRKRGGYLVEHAAGDRDGAIDGGRQPGPDGRRQLDEHAHDQRRQPDPGRRCRRLERDHGHHGQYGWNLDAGQHGQQPHRPASIRRLPYLTRRTAALTACWAAARERPVKSIWQRGP